MKAERSLHIVLPAIPGSAPTIRRSLCGFLAALRVDSKEMDDVVTAVGEAVANAVEHAYRNSSPKDVRVDADMGENGVLVAQVSDRGTFIEPTRREGRGFGLRIIRAVAETVSIDTQKGTCVRMTFRMQAPLRAAG